METLSFILTAVPYAGTTTEIPGMNRTSWFVVAGIIAFLILCYLLLGKNKPEKF
jgi:hypothetical protein